MKPIRRDYFPRIEQFITEYREANGTAPSIKEIAAYLNVCNTTAWRYIQRMASEGLLDYQGGYGRISTISSLKESEPSQAIPSVGSISCGLPLLAEENIEEYVRLPRSWIGSGDNMFILRAEGQSMINAGINTGDLVLVRQQQTAEPGQIIVALVDESSATLKRYYPRLEDQAVELRPENDAYETQIIDLRERAFAIQGIAVKVLKDI